MPDSSEIPSFKCPRICNAKMVVVRTYKVEEAFASLHGTLRGNIPRKMCNFFRL
jgi:hypothetical protein